MKLRKFKADMEKKIFNDTYEFDDLKIENKFEETTMQYY